MADTTKIEWTDATWNIITGCTLVDEGCRHCYAAHLITSWPAIGNHPSRKGLARKNAAGESKFTGEVRFNEQWLHQPLRWKKPRKIFVCAHGDLFHPAVPDDWIDRVFAVMALAPQHTFQVLTKRPERAIDYLSDTLDRIEAIEDCADELLGSNDMPFTPHWPLPNVWLGTSISDQASADLRIPELLACPAAVRFISAEPLLGPVDLSQWMGVHHSRDNNLSDPETRAAIETMIRLAREKFREEHGNHGIDWVIVGGESGPHARAMHPEWARSLRDQCAAAGVAFLFKQWGEWLPLNQTADGAADDYYHPAPVRDPDASRRCKYDSLCLSTDGTAHPIGAAGGYHISTHGMFSHHGDMSMFRVGKRAAGRLLDFTEHNGFPGVQP